MYITKQLNTPLTYWTKLKNTGVCVFSALDLLSTHFPHVIVFLPQSVPHIKCRKIVPKYR